MRFLIIGLGSMGKRRIRNLQELGYTEIAGFSRSLENREEAWDRYGIVVYDRLDTALLYKPNVFIICTPPDQHREYQLKAMELGIPYFVEHSVLNEGLLEYDMGVPSATLMFHPRIKSLKRDFNRYKEVNTFKYSCNSWLPDWHPVRKDGYYAFKKEVNGCKEMIPFELAWITDIFGSITYVESMAWNSGLFGFNDSYRLQLEFDSGVKGIVEIDVITPSAKGGNRKFTLIGDKGTISYKILYSDGMYMKEMKAFLKHVKGEEVFPHTLEKDHELLKVLEMIEK